MEKYKYLIVPLITLIVTQLIKFTFESIRGKKIKWGRLFNGSGGMPSSHSAFAFSITAMIGLNEGMDSILFAISLVFSLIVAYDAMGLRMESGRHAERLNDISEEIFSKKYKTGLEHLKEELGHNPLEVLVGMIFAILSSMFFTYVIF